MIDVLVFTYYCIVLVGYLNFSPLDILVVLISIGVSLLGHRQVIIDMQVKVLMQGMLQRTLNF